jgi:energy-coupling factor transport system ATP-binding protein
MVGMIPHLVRGKFFGRVWVDGLRTDQTPLWELTEKAGLVFQNPANQMVAPTVEEEIIFGLENLGLSSSEITQRTAEMLAFFDLEKYRTRPPSMLSGGEQQKLALACIIARQAPALILDEPLSMLDSTAAHEFISYLDHLHDTGKTVVILEHRKEYVQAIVGLQTVKLGDPKPGFSEDQFLIANELLLPQTNLDLEPAPIIAAHFTLQLNHISVERGGKQILNNLTLSIASGQVVAVIGRNGIGKTTLLRAMTGLQEFSGQMVVRVQECMEEPDFGLVFQNPDLQLFNPTVADEILYKLPRPDQAWYAWLLHILDLERYERSAPLLLSEGEKRRVALACVLMRKPKHGILLDEPSLGQDSWHKAVLARTAHSLAQMGRLVIMATHDLELAAQANRIILLGPEGVLADGPSEQIIQAPDVWDKAGIWMPDWIKVMQ